MSDRMTYTSEKLSWDEIVRLVTGVIERQLGRKVRCRASMENCTYWCVSATDARFTIAEIEQLLRFTVVDEDTRLEELPTDAAASCSFGMGLSRLCDSDAMQIFLSDWKRFTDDLQFVMSDMMVFLMKKERQVERDEQKS